MFLTVAVGGNDAALPSEEVGAVGQEPHGGVVGGGMVGRGRRRFRELVIKSLIFQFQPPFGFFGRLAAGDCSESWSSKR